MILVGIGASLPGPHGSAPRATCAAAAEALGAIPGLTLVALSRWWESAPLPPMPGAPPFVNGVARLEGGIAPEALLDALQAIEARFGRTRPYPNAPRTLDLDVLDQGGLVLATGRLTLPHPRMTDRAFVLRPLAEVAPEWRHPVSGLGVAALLAALPPQEIAPLPAEAPPPVGWAPALRALALALALAAPTAAAEEGGRVAAGRAFVETHCAACHASGRTGTSPLPAAPALRDLHRRYPVEHLAEAFAEGIETGHPGMPAFRLDTRQIDDLIAYLRSLAR